MVSLNNSNIKILTIYKLQNTVYIQCSYTDSIEDLPLKMVLTWIKDNVKFVATTKLTLTAYPPLKSYSSSSSYGIGMFS